MGKKRIVQKRRFSSRRLLFEQNEDNIVHEPKTSRRENDEEIIEILEDKQNEENIAIIEIDDVNANIPASSANNAALIDTIDSLLCTTNFILIQGPFGCGKTHSAQILSERRGLPLHSLQINDQYDSKILYGSYICTEVPGEFVWQESKFSKCIKKPGIILLENIDHGGSELTSTIISLVENGQVNLPNGKAISIHKECQIIATISLDESYDLSKIPLQLREYPYTVKMAELGEPELNAIIAESMPRLNAMREKLIRMFFDVREHIRAHKVSIDRSLNAKDLFRAAKRLQKMKDLQDSKLILMELLDVWAMHLTNQELRRRIGTIIAETLSLADGELNYLMNVRQPEITSIDNKIGFGRSQLSRKLKGPNHSLPNFVLTLDTRQLIERIAVCVKQGPHEPILLTGETGVGKTSAIQYLASAVNVPLRVVNLNHDSEFTDLIGGYKPTSPTNILRPLADDYFKLFKKLFGEKKNAKFLENLNKCFNAQRFGDFIQLLIKSTQSILRKYPNQSKWMDLLQRARKLARCFGQGDQWKRRLLFSYVKGIVTEAAENGHWLLVDEINLASAECLDVFMELLEPTNQSQIHSDFRFFACMNHATDIGKRSLPSGIRSKFTEFYVAEITNPDQLRILIKGQFPTLKTELVESILNFYLEICAQFPGKFSLRTLSRTISIASDQLFSCQRTCLVHGCKIAFSSQLGAQQRIQMNKLVGKHFNLSSNFKFPTICSKQIDSSKFILIENNAIQCGNELILGKDDNYIFTPSVRTNMAFLASIVSTGKFPILMEGETSAGKTSLIIQLAKMSGNRCYRINNHEHIDIQEYIGNYAPDAEGRLQFVEGILLRAVRNGDWIILDELNLAPSSVLEALNRLLDDNRELYVHELNTTIKAHPRFQLFATQNPVGTYSGRKRLSRAFLNRFIVIQCDSLPFDELPEIVHKRCGIAPIQADLMVNVLRELKAQRTISGMFTFSEGLMTLRDLFRWGNRVASLDQIDDWRQSIVDQGYFVLAARCRTKQDESIIVEVLERQLNRKIQIDQLFNAESIYLPKIELPKNIVPTKQLRRILILCSEAWKCNEPVLLVGETGCGKTTAVHLFGSILSINCHEKTDASDLLGSIRPITNGGGFKWQDGIVLQAMRQGQRLLIDEISLAPDSVLERLNSLLEPQRTILLTDPGAVSNSSNNFEEGGIVSAADEFQLVATMNPGNDHGKKELSKALRNRFTEIWCPQENDRIDLLEILRKRLLNNDKNGKLMENDAQKVAQFLIEFSEFFAREFNEILRFIPSTRDLVGLAELFMEFYNFQIELLPALYHSIETNLLDAIEVIPSKMAIDRHKMIEKCRKQFQILANQLFLNFTQNFMEIAENNILLAENAISIGPFKIQCTSSVTNSPKFPQSFSLNAPTTRKNALRVARALYSSKPVMLEGSPGAGKSSLIMAIAAASNHKLVRLNLSEQTDLYDLFGTDIPVVGPDGSTPSFAWRDGPVLKAIKEGSWILLDEMNLASQSVLEGLNSCFDFRKNIFIAELNKTFDVNIEKCRFFACQNPHSQGSGRRALPKSFLNRFISIFIEEMTDADFIYILCEFSRNRQAPYFTDELISKMVLVNKMCQQRIQNSSWALQNGGPFEFNLRDLFRWVEAIEKFNGNIHFGFELIYLNRLKSNVAREKVIDEIFNLVFVDNKWTPSLPLIHLVRDEQVLSIGNVKINMPSNSQQITIQNENNNHFLMSTQMDLLEKLAACAQANWLVLLIGPSHAGKRSTLRILAELCGQQIERMQLNSGTDALDLLGSFEQIAIETIDEDEENSSENNSNSMSKTKSNIRFEWVDSVFLRAFRDGHWLLVEDVNCCNSAVLDCLNSCLESADGELVLPVNEIKTIRRHPNFRLFFTMNPKNGQLSRSMRNRAVEIQFCAEQNSSSLWSRNIFDTITTVFGTSPNETMAELTCPETHLLLQKLQIILSQISTQTLLNSAALMHAKMKWKEPISTESGFQGALNVLLTFLERNVNGQTIGDDQIKPLMNIVEIVPTEFPPLTRLPAPNFGQTFVEFAKQLFGYYERCFKEVSNNLFDDHSLSIVCTQLAEGMKEFIQKQCKYDSIKIDNLLEDTFPELRNASLLWRQLSEKASNESDEGQSYLNALRSNLICKPFKKQPQIKQFAKKWREENEFICYKNEDKTTTLFGPLKEHLSKLFHLFAFIFGQQQTSASSLIQWKEPSEETMQQFTFLQIMSTRIGRIFTNEFGLAETQLYSHLHCNYLSLAANKLLWGPLGYNKNILREVRIGQLQNCREQMEQTLELFWNLTFAQKGIKSSTEKNWQFCQTKIIKNNAIEGHLKTFIFKILDAIELLTPPEHFVDPFYFALRQSTFYEFRMEKLNLYFQALQQFLQLTISKCFHFEGISNAILQMPNCSNFLKLLANAWNSTVSILNKLTNENEFDGKMWCENNDEDGRIYRGIWQHGEEMAYENNFQNSIIVPLRWCTAQLRELFNGSIYLQNVENIRERDIQLFSAHLSNIIHTIDSMIDRICNIKASSNNSQLTLAIYPEIIAPYLFLLNSLKIAIAEFLQEKQQKLKENHQIIQPFPLNLSSTNLDDLLNWIFQQQPKLLPQQKLQICLWAFSTNCDLNKHHKKTFIQWLIDEWENWHEENAKQKKEQFFVLKAKKSNKNEEEEDGEMETNEQEDYEEQQIRSYLPDYSEANFDENELDNATFNGGPMHLNGDEINSALRSIYSAFIDNQPNPSKTKFPFLCLMQIMDQYKIEHSTENAIESNFAHLSCFAEIRNNLLQFDGKEVNKMKGTSPILNVYKESDPAALIQCLSALGHLLDSANRLLNEFPENATLLHLKEAINIYANKAPADAPLMKHAAQLERILTHAEEWESISDRAHSIREQMIPLQTLLLGWRHLEVKCWNELVKHVQQDCAQLTVLVSFPLFKVAIEYDGTNNNDTKLLLMFLEWIQNSTLGDFEIRLWTGRLLSNFLAIFEGEEKPSLSAKINTIVCHFEQFIGAVREKYSTKYKEIEMDLRNFIRVVRYTDLNLWSVHDSAKKAHVQLFRILRNYKEMFNESLCTLLLDKLPKLPEIALKNYRKLPTIADKFTFSKLPLAQMFASFGNRFECSTLELLDFDGIDAMKEAAIDLLKLIKTDLNYEDPNGGKKDGKGDQKSADEVKLANEKMQGRALFERQQFFAKLLRTTTQFGLASRRAQNLDSEALTIQTLAEIPLLNQFDGSEKLNQLFRHAVASRNVFLRQFAACRRQQQAHLMNQISVANLEHLHGIVEFGLHWLYCALRALEQKVTREGWNLQQISKCFDAQLANFNIEKDQSKLDHSLMNAKFMENCKNFDQIASIAEKMRQILCCCPKRTSSELTNLGASIQNLQEPLGQLREDDQEYRELLAELDALNTLIYQIVNLHKEEAQHILYLPIGGQNPKEWSAIWYRDRMDSYESTFTQLVGMLRTSLDGTKIGHYFPNESKQICSLIDKQHSPQNMELNDFNGQFELTELDTIKNSLLLHFQSIYKEIEQLNGNNNAMKPLDCVKQLIGFIGQSGHLEGSEKLGRLFLAIQLQSSSPCQNSLEKSCTLAKGTSLIFGSLLHYLREFICQLASFQAIWIEIGSHLLAKGFVNQIPNPEQAKGEDKVTKDGCGFGEGDVTADAKDVGAEVETMEQIEGLKENGQKEGEANEDQTGQDQQKLPEVDQPIDVEDDFAGNLEGLDAEEQQQDGQEEIDEGEEHTEDQANWDFGDVDEAEETQLDPKLWEPEAEDKQGKEEMKDGGKEGAQELTDELTAAQDEVEQIAEGNDANLDQQTQKEVQEKEDFEMNNDEQKQQNEEGNLNDAEMEEEENGEEGRSAEKEMEMAEQKEGDEQIDEEEMMEIEEDEEVVERGENCAEMADPNENVAAEDKEEECSPNEANSPNEQMPQQPEAVGVDEGMPNAGKADDDDETENDGDERRRMEGANGGNDNGQNPKENHLDQTNSSNAALQTRENSKLKENSTIEEERLKERSNEQQKGPESSNQSAEEREENIEENNATEELEPSDEQNFSAQATSTEEQARRTRKIFEATLQRLKKFMNKEGDLAKQNEEEERNKFSKMGENDADGMELDVENEHTGTGIAEENDGQLERNIFLQLGDKQNPNVLATNDGIDTAIIDKLCSEFDRMEQQQNDNNQSPNNEERMPMELQRKWAMITDSIAPLAAELTESLRTILEPTIANRLQGDYRTGKRLNMRRLITFIASDYRKDRIWLRRTKLAKRNYQICIAVDNSQSMQHNHMTEITCNALCLIQRALNQLEIGQLAICSFGSQVNLVNDFTSATGGDDPNLGIRILQELKFDQQRTDLAGMLSSCFALFKMARERSTQPVEQMLIILGDGRGVLTEGVERINKALTQLNSNHVTVLYLIMDSMDKSIMQMRIADFNNGKCTFRPYMQSFPFQLFAIVKNTHSLPATMAEAVRQWFEYTSTSGVISTIDKGLCNYGHVHNSAIMGVFDYNKSEIGFGPNKPYTIL